MKVFESEKGEKVRLITITAIVTFSLSAILFAGVNFLNARYLLSFPKSSVSQSEVSKFNEAKNILKKNYYKDVSTDKLLEGAIAGMADSLDDPYTVYYDKEHMKAFTDLQKNTENDYVGVGLPITLDKKGLITVLEPFDDSPAQKAGIRKGDKIIKIDGKDITGLKDENLTISMIKGQENTEVVLTVYREIDNSTFDVKVMRKKIKAAINIRSEMLANNIGYIKLKLFDEDISSNFIKQLNSLVNQGAKSLIIDVRDNPGGLYNEVVKMADRLLPKGTIVYTEDRQGNKKEQMSDANQLNMPIVVLTNGSSASASEILTGALKDFKKATIIGTKTYGKGLVQTTYRFPDDTGLKVTIARYFTPSGVCIQGEGIKPDIEVKLPAKYDGISVSVVPREDDLQLKKAIEVLAANK